MPWRREQSEGDDGTYLLSPIAGGQAIYLNLGYSMILLEQERGEDMVEAQITLEPCSPCRPQISKSMYGDFGGAQDHLH